MKHVLSFLVFFALTFTAAAQNYQQDYQGDPLQTIPLSKGQLKAYALANAKQGYLTVYSEGILYSSTAKTFIWTQGKNASDVQKILSQDSGFSFQMFNPSKSIMCYSTLSDSDGMPLMQSQYAAATLQQQNGQWKLACEPLQMKVNYTIQLAYPNAIYAWLDVIDESGNPERIGLTVQNGKITMLTQYSGHIVDLVVGTWYPKGGPGINPGTQMETAYNADGDKIVPIVATGKVATTIMNHATASDQGLGNGSIMTCNQVAALPATNDGEIIDPPSATMTITAPTATERTCIWTIVLASQPISRADDKPLKAYANRTELDGSVTEETGIVTTSNANGVFTISVTFRLDNNQGASTDWQAYLDMSAYERQGAGLINQNQGGKG